MEFRVIGFCLVLCTVASASPFFDGPDFSLFDQSTEVIHTSCSLFAGIVRMFPLNSPEIEKVSFELRTPCNRTQYTVSEAKNLTNSPQFNRNQKTVVVVTGFMSTINDDYLERLSKAYLCRGGYNFIVVDTSSFLKTEYINSAYNTEKLGEIIAVGLKNLNISGENLHLMGHSLGAHIMGGAARLFASNTGVKIGRVTGFDPARPCFIRSPVFSRLSADDATFVDIIHSNPRETGTEEAIGHVDFYPNGLQPTQPSCLTIDLLCSHTRCMDYYSETVYSGNEHNFMGTKCKDIKSLTDKNCNGTSSAMGFAADNQARGIYYLEVNSSAPFGKNATTTEDPTLSECGACAKQ